MLNVKNLDKNLPVMQQFMRFSQQRQEDPAPSYPQRTYSTSSQEIRENAPAGYGMNQSPYGGSQHSQGVRSFENLDNLAPQEPYSPYKPQHGSRKPPATNPNYQQNYNPLNDYIPPSNPFSQSYDSQGYINPPSESNLQTANFSKKPFEVEFY
jgi:hypothetical protein